MPAFIISPDLGIDRREFGAEEPLAVVRGGRVYPLPDGCLPPLEELEQEIPSYDPIDAIRRRRRTPNR